ncbi:MAG: hypothetical protein Q9227_001024 [Pyrenula ochraceoflavens]
MLVHAVVWAAIPAVPLLSQQAEQYPLPVSYGGPLKSNSSIPGNSPFDHCEQSDTANDLFQIEWLAVTPTPPNIGEPFNFQAHGYFTEPLTSNATINVTGWYETNPLAPFSSTKPFCQMVDQVDMDEYGLQCPPSRGNGTITAIEAVPWGLPEVSAQWESFPVIPLIKEEHADLWVIGELLCAG